MCDSNTGGWVGVGMAKRQQLKLNCLALNLTFGLIISPAAALQSKLIKPKKVTHSAKLSQVFINTYTMCTTQLHMQAHTPKHINTLIERKKGFRGRM